VATDLGERIESRVISSTSLGTAEKVLTLAIAMAELNQKFGEQVTESKEYADAVFEYAETHAEVFLKVCSADEIRDLVADLPGFSHATDAYRKRGANALAELSSFKLR
jgi:hypothetical protein